MSERVVELGELVAVAVRSSVNFSMSAGRSETKVSTGHASTRVAILLRLSCVFRSASNRAEVAPTPKTIPAVEGGVRRDNSSGMRSLSLAHHCLIRGKIDEGMRDSGRREKKRGSLKASETSFLQGAFCPALLPLPEELEEPGSGRRESSCSNERVERLKVSGKDLDRKAGARTLEEIEEAAASTRSGSTRILGREGTMEARMPTTSSARSWGRRGLDVVRVGGERGRLEESGMSEKLMGRVVKIAVRRRRKRSWYS